MFLYRVVITGLLVQRLFEQQQRYEALHAELARVTAEAVAAASAARTAEARFTATQEELLRKQAQEKEAEDEWRALDDDPEVRYLCTVFRQVHPFGHKLSCSCVQ